jgi:hypothetical protein
VKINLQKHITEGWTSIIELAYYQADVKSNVYGVRLGEKRKLYDRYFEFNLERQPVQQLRNLRKARHRMFRLKRLSRLKQ